MAVGKRNTGTGKCEVCVCVCVCIEQQNMAKRPISFGGYNTSRDIVRVSPLFISLQYITDGKAKILQAW